MGVFYGIKCPECGKQFSHFAGVGFSGIVPTGGSSDPEDSFTCPECGHIIDPTDDNFAACVLGHGFWD